VESVTYIQELRELETVPDCNVNWNPDGVKISEHPSVGPNRTPGLIVHATNFYENR
jgi:hypothetical protein